MHAADILSVLQTTLENVTIFLRCKERKLNVRKISRKRPGRFLNVLCKFELRPASRGEFAFPCRHNVDTSY